MAVRRLQELRELERQRLARIAEEERIRKEQEEAERKRRQKELEEEQERWAARARNWLEAFVEQAAVVVYCGLCDVCTGCTHVCGMIQGL